MYWVDAWNVCRSTFNGTLRSVSRNSSIELSDRCFVLVIWPCLGFESRRTNSDCWKRNTILKGQECCYTSMVFAFWKRWQPETAPLGQKLSFQNDLPSAWIALVLIITRPRDPCKWAQGLCDAQWAFHIGPQPSMVSKTKFPQRVCRTTCSARYGSLQITDQHIASLSSSNRLLVPDSNHFLFI